MADIWMDVDIALSEVPVNIFPLLDDTDFKTRETAVAYNASGMDLVWNFVTTGGAMTQTAVTPTTGGAYDWAHQGDGMYSIEIPASGGASINNDTEGFGWFTGLATGVLPWRGPVIGFRAAAINTSLISGAALDVNSVTGDVLGGVGSIAGTVGTFDALITAKDSDWGGLASTETGTLQSATATTAVLDDAPTTVIVSGNRDNDDYLNGMILLLTGGTGAGQARRITDYAGSTFTATVETWNVTPSSDTTYEILPDADYTPGQVADAVWDEDTSGHVTSGTFGEQVKTDIDAILVDTGTTLDGAIATVDANVDAILVDTGTTLDGKLDTLQTTASAILTDTGTTLDGKLDTIDANVDAILVDTAEIGVAGAGLTAVASDAPTAAEVATAVLTTQMTESYAADGAAPTLTQALMLIQQVLTEFGISTTTLTVKKIDGLTTAATFTLSDATTPTSLTRAT